MRAVVSRPARAAVAGWMALLTAGLLIAGPGLAGEAAGKPVVVIETSLGEIRIELDLERAPITGRNFLRYVDSKRYDGATFYRAMNQSRDGSDGLVQGGVQSRPRYALAPIAHESTVDTGLSHVDGAVSMARGEKPGSARGEFFIVVGSMINYDGVPNGGDPGFAVFGRVVAGMPVVRRIMRLPRSREARSEQMQGQMLAEPVTILSARRATTG